MKIFLLTPLLANLVFFSPIAVSIGWSEPALANNRCLDPVGRIYESNNAGVPKGKLLCVNERLQLVQSGAIPNIRVFCFASGQYKTFSNSVIVSSFRGCEPPKQARPLRFCPGDSAMLCETPKGTTSAQVGLRLVQPFGRAVLTTPNVLTWVPVATANRYLVQVERDGAAWQRMVTQASVPLPPNEQWQTGSAYTVTIAAYSSQGVLLSARKSVINRLTAEAAQDVAAKVNQIQRLEGSDPDEIAAVDLTNLYLSQGLLGEAQRVLDRRVQARTQNPIVYRVLGDLYLQARLPQQAKSYYEKAIQLASVKKQEAELVAARSGLAALKGLSAEY